MTFLTASAATRLLHAWISLTDFRRGRVFCSGDGRCGSCALGAATVNVRTQEAVEVLRSYAKILAPARSAPGAAPGGPPPERFAGPPRGRPGAARARGCGYRGARSGWRPAFRFRGGTTECPAAARERRPATQAPPVGPAASRVCGGRASTELYPPIPPWISCGPKPSSRAVMRRRRDGAAALPGDCARRVLLFASLIPAAALAAARLRPAVRAAPHRREKIDPAQRRSRGRRPLRLSRDLPPDPRLAGSPVGPVGVERVVPRPGSCPPPGGRRGGPFRVAAERRGRCGPARMARRV